MATRSGEGIYLIETLEPDGTWRVAAYEMSERLARQQVSRSGKTERYRPNPHHPCIGPLLKRIDKLEAALRQIVESSFSTGAIREGTIARAALAPEQDE
jgi:hypothetical protein